MLPKWDTDTSDCFRVLTMKNNRDVAKQVETLFHLLPNHMQQIKQCDGKFIN